MQKNEPLYLFICGCARSGTSVLWQVISSHNNIILGLERYIHKSTKRNFSLEKSLFEKERFFEIQKGDTHFSSLYDKEISKIRYEAYKMRFDEKVYIGDKVPRLYESYDQFFRVFPNGKILFIFRNIFDIAQSYKARCQNQGDNWNRGIVEAVSDWNYSLQSTYDGIQNSYNIFPVNYEKLFFGNSSLHQIFNFLNLKLSKNSIMELSKQRKKAKKILSRHDGILTPLEKQYIITHAKFFLYKKIMKIRKLKTKR